MEINNYIIECENDLHSLLEADIITYDEYMTYLDELELQNKKPEALKTSTRTNWKKKFFDLLEAKEQLEKENEELKRTINNMKWDYSNTLNEKFYDMENN